MEDLNRCFFPSSFYLFCRGHSGDKVNNIFKRQIKNNQIRRFREINLSSGQNGAEPNSLVGQASSAQITAKSK